MIAEFSPALVLILGALFIPLLPAALRSGYMLGLPVLALAQLWSLPMGETGQLAVLDLTLTTLRVDKLSLIFSTIFLIAAFLSVLYALHIRDTVQQVCALAYAGCAVGAALAGDLVTLFVYWEGTAITSVFLIWASRTQSAYRAGMRYIAVQVGSGVVLLAGLLVHYHDTSSIAFDAMSIETWGGKLILLAIGIKCAFPLLHSWLQDAYPEATVTGTVWLSAFTTKLAVYALARGYAGTEILIWIGATMAAFPIIFALIENDLRRVLTFSLNSQLGFMVVGVGIGTELAVNGAVAHAFCSVIYQGLLFMTMGAVLLRVGTCKSTELGGLYKSMPWTTGFCLIGAASISAFPLLLGFVSKSLILSAAIKEGYFAAWLILLAASIGAVLHTGLQVPFRAFFAHDSGLRVKEAPLNMLLAMAAAAALCILIGIFPSALHNLLPYAVKYDAYTLEHVVTQLQLLVFSALAFTFLVRTGLYPQGLRSTNLDIDWFIRKPGMMLVRGFIAVTGWVHAGVTRLLLAMVHGIFNFVQRHTGPDGVLGRSWPTGSMAFWTTALLAAYLLAYYV